VQTPKRAWQISYIDGQLTNETIAQQSLQTMCQEVDPLAHLWSLYKGLPVMGPWALAGNLVAANAIKDGGDRIGVELPDNVTGIEVSFVVAAEPNNRPTWGDMVSYSLIACTEELPNGIDDDCDGVIDNGLSPAATTFEDTGDGVWQSDNAAIGYSSSRYTEGTSSLLVSANGYVQITSPTFLASEYIEVGDELLLDVYLQGNQPNPGWLGEIALYITIPDENLFNQHLGSVGLTGLAQDSWNTVSFQVPDNIKSILLLTESAVRFHIALNLPYGAPSVYLDDLRFAGDLVARYSGAPTRSELADLLSFEQLSDWHASGADLDLNETFVSDGASSLAVFNRTSSYTVVTSESFFGHELEATPHQLSIDLYLEHVPAWGDVSLVMSCPMYQNAFLGTHAFSSMGTGFNTLSFDIPGGLQDAITADNAECTVTFNLNTPIEETFYLDNIAF
jgi:hypothetical protein